MPDFDPIDVATLIAEEESVETEPPERVSNWLFWSEETGLQQSSLKWTDELSGYYTVGNDTDNPISSGNYTMNAAIDGMFTIIDENGTEHVFLP